MSQTLSLDATARKLSNDTPWVLIAVLLHVVVIAIASVMYYVHGSTADDRTPTVISMAPPAALIEEIQPVIVDRENVPKIFDNDATVAEQTNFNLQPTEDQSMESSESGSTSDFSSLVSGEPCGSPIGVHGPGRFGEVPSAKYGPKGGGKKYDGRFNAKGGPNTRPPHYGAVSAGLEWLRKHQDEDGKWDADRFAKHDVDGAPCTGPGNGANDVGITGLALLAFLGDGNTLKFGAYRKVVLQGTRWLLDQQDPVTGLIGAPVSQGFMYSHAIATLALCETYGLTDNYPRYREPVQKAINYIAQARNPYGVWRYEPRAADGDTSITGWMVQALLSAKEFELQVDDAALKSALVWFDSVTDANGASGYTKAGEGSSRPVGKLTKFPQDKSEAMTAVVLLCRHLMHEAEDSKLCDLSAQVIMKKPPVWNTTDGSIDMYYWYYASYALFQQGGRAWQDWSKKMTAAVVKSQSQDGNAKGSWDPVDAWGDDGGRVYSTAIMVLCLEAYWRYGKIAGAR